MLTPLIFAALMAAAPEVDGAAKLQSELEEMRRHHLDEAALLNRQIKLPPLQVWESGQNVWQMHQQPELLSGVTSKARIRVVHLWAHWCEPCKKEFLLLKEIDQNMRVSYKKDIDFIYVSVDTTDPDGMQEYMKKYDERMPVGLKYGDGTRALIEMLEQALPQSVQKTVLRDASARARKLPLPMTVVLDRDDMVRLAFIGSVDGRRAELANGMKLLQSWALSKEKEREATAACAKMKMAKRPAGSLSQQ